MSDLVSMLKKIARAGATGNAYDPTRTLYWKVAEEIATLQGRVKELEIMECECCGYTGNNLTKYRKLLQEASDSYLTVALKRVSDYNSRLEYALRRIGNLNDHNFQLVDAVLISDEALLPQAQPLISNQEGK